MELANSDKCLYNCSVDKVCYSALSLFIDYYFFTIHKRQTYLQDSFLIWI